MSVWDAVFVSTSEETGEDTNVCVWREEGAQPASLIGSYIRDVKSSRVKKGVSRGLR